MHNPSAPAGVCVRLARTPAEIEAAQRLRYQVFALEKGADIPNVDGKDIDRYDPYCRHLLAFEPHTQEVVGCYRLLTWEGAQQLGGWYSESEFDLSPLTDIFPHMVELGRACIREDYRHGGVVMALWAGLTRFMHENNLRFMTGCGSIGTEDGGHTAAALYHELKQKYLAPAQWQVRPRHPLNVEGMLPVANPECPALIKGYLKAGAWFCGAPCLDEAFNCADVLILMDLTQLNQRYVQRFAPEMAASLSKRAAAEAG